MQIAKHNLSYDTERSINKLPGSNPVGPSSAADIICIACIRHSPPANRKRPQAVEGDRPTRETNVNGSGRQTNSSFSNSSPSDPISDGRFAKNLGRSRKSGS